MFLFLFLLLLLLLLWLWFLGWSLNFHCRSLLAAEQASILEAEHRPARRDMMTLVEKRRKPIWVVWVTKTYGKRLPILYYGWWSIMTPTCDGMRYLYSLRRCDSWKFHFVRIEYSQFSGSPHFSHTKITHKNFKKRYETWGMTDTSLTRTKILRKKWSQMVGSWVRLGQIVSASPWPPLLTTSGGLKLVARLIAVLQGRGKSKDATLRIMGSQNWWFGDPRPLLYTSKPLYSWVQWFLGNRQLQATSVTRIDKESNFKLGSITPLDGHQCNFRFFLIYIHFI